MYIEKAPKLITAKMIQKDEELEGLLLTEIKRNYYYAEQFVSPKQERLRQYDQRTLAMTAEGKLRPQLTHQMKKTFIAMFKAEGLVPVFEGFDRNDNELADKLNQIAKFDQKVMKKIVKDEIMLSNVFDYGVGIRIGDYYDSKYNVTQFKTVDPLSWYPDPNGNSIDNDYDYHFFVIQSNLNDLRAINAEYGEEIYWNIDKITNVTPLNNNTYFKKQLRKISDSEYYPERCYLYYMLLTVNGRKYRATLSNNLTAINRREEIEPISTQERECPHLVQFDLAITCPFPLPSDPFGVSYRELIIDKDAAMTKIANALMYKELRNAGNDNYLVDMDVVRNAHLLSYRPEEGPAFIPVKNQGKPVAGAVAPVMDVQNTNQQYSFYQWLGEQAKQDTLLTDIVRGAGAGADTLGQSEILAQKANINFSLDADMLGVGEQMFWDNIYYRNLKINVIKIKDKVINISGSFDDFIKLANTDFIGSFDPNIDIASSKKKTQEDLNKSIKLQALLPLLQNSQGELPISMKLYLREIFRREGFDRSFIMAILKESPSETHARIMQKIINIGQTPKNLFKPGVDNATLLIYIQQCVENEIKQKALIEINAQILEEGLNQQGQDQMSEIGTGQGGSMQGVANAMGSQMLSNSIKNNEQSQKQFSLGLQPAGNVE